LDSKRREDFEINLNSLLRSLEVELRSIQDVFGPVQQELGEIRSKPSNARGRNKSTTRITSSDDQRLEE